MPKIISNKRQVAVLLLVVTLVGTFLRLYRLGSNSLWLDETVSVWFANRSLGDVLLVQPAADVHPPLYYLILSLWIKAFGSEEFQVRLLSAIFGIVSIPLLYFVVKNLFRNSSTAMVSAFILSISPFHIYYSQETRMYSLLTFFVLLSIFFMIKMLTVANQKEEVGKTLFYSVNYVLSTTAAIYCHNIALFLPIAQNLFFITFWRKLKPLLKFWIPSGAIILLLWAPWASFFLKQSSMVQKGLYVTRITFGSIANVFNIFNNGPFFWLFNWMSMDYLNLIRGRLTLLTLIFFGALFLIGVVSMRHNPRPLVFLLFTFVVPVGAEVLVSLKRPILATQTLIWASIPYYVLIAKGIVGLRNRWGIAIAIAFLTIFNCSALYKYYTEFEKERWDLVAHYVSDNVDKNDLFLFNSGFGQIPFDYYFYRYDKLNIEEHGVPQDLSEKSMSLESLPRLKELIHGHKRIWLIYSHEWFTDSQRLVKATLEHSHCLSTQRGFESGQNSIVCYLFVKCEQ
jgi:mannosyltransferase